MKFFSTLREVLAQKIEESEPAMQCPGCGKRKSVRYHNFKMCVLLDTMSKGPHPDAVEAMRIKKELKLDPDIAAIIDSSYVDAKGLLLAQLLRNTKPTGKTSDGYHTFDELYDHRITLFIALCRKLHETRTVWRSERHSNGEQIKGWFLLGINTQMGEQITYHIPMSRWDECKFASKADYAPAFDGHTSADVLDRLKKL